MIEISGRNQLTGKVVSVSLGDIMAEVAIKVGENEITSVITRKSAVSLKLKEGDAVTALIKSTEVMIIKGKD
jgi:molybdopterin-binding protein